MLRIPTSVMKMNLSQDCVQAILSAMDLSYEMKTEPTTAKKIKLTSAMTVCSENCKSVSLK